MNTFKDTDVVAVGIDAAVVANHYVIVRRPAPGGVGEVVDDFIVPPTLDGLTRLTDRLARRRVSLAVHSRHIECAPCCPEAYCEVALGRANDQYQGVANVTQ